jgi:hypothetical protein
MGWADRITLEEVVDHKTFCQYSSQVAGIPYPTNSHLNKAKTLLAELFEMYPALTWKGLCQLPLWAKHRKKRYAHCLQLINAYRFAYQDGWLPEIDVDAVDRQMEEKINQALEIETDPAWRRRLLSSRGTARREVYERWASRVDT